MWRDEFKCYTVAGLVIACVIGVAAELPAAAMRHGARSQQQTIHLRQAFD